TRQQMAEIIRGQAGADGIRRAIQNETEARLRLYQNVALSVPDGERREISEGAFLGNFIDNSGNIYNWHTGGNLLGHVGPDNVVAVVVRYDPSAGATSQTEGH